MTSLDGPMAALHSDDPTRRQQAAMRLGTLDTTPVMSELVAAMAREPDDFVRETLIWAVCTRPKAASEALVAALGRDDLPREPVLHALSKVGDPATVPAILAYADDPDAAVAGKAWWALVRIGGEKVLPRLLPHLGAADGERRNALSRALLQVGAPAIRALAEALNEEDPAVRSHAAEVLIVFADPTRYGSLERRSGADLSTQATDVLRTASAPEVDGALLLATMEDDRPGLAELAARLRDERA